MDTRPLRKLRLPLALAALLGAVYAGTYAVSPSGAGPASTPALQWTLAAFLTALGVLTVQAVRFFVLDVVFYRTQGHRAPALIHSVVALVLYFGLGLLVAGGVFGQSLTGAIATGAVASVVLGLALQETLGNFFAGIALQAEQPFRLGDVIQTGGVEGRVEAFNWRATTLTTVLDSRVVIPNAAVAREAVEVFPSRWTTRRVLTIPAPYGTPPQQVARVVLGAVAGVPGVADRPAPQVRLASFDESSVGYEMLYSISDALQGPAVDATIRERVWYAFARTGISIPFPHQVQVPYEPPEPAEDEDPVAERARWLGEVELLAPLTVEERDRLAETARTLLYCPGEAVIRAGADGASMFVVLRGRVEIRVPHDNGVRVRVAELGPGEVIGEMSLLTGEPRSADARAVDEVEVLEVRREDLREILEANGALAAALACEVSERVAQRADAFALVDKQDGRAPEAESLLQRIRHLFDLA